MSNERSDAAGYLGWFLFGTAVGAVVALVTTPRTGRETRGLLAERSQDVAKRAQELANGVQGNAGEWVDKSRELFEEQTQRLMTALEAGKEAMRDEIRKWSSTTPRD